MSSYSAGNLPAGERCGGGGGVAAVVFPLPIGVGAVPLCRYAGGDLAVEPGQQRTKRHCALQQSNSTFRFTIEA